MSEMYPNECCRCGYCCLVENCPNAQTFFNIPECGVTCPALIFKEDLAICTLANINPDLFGIGLGCCIKARAIMCGEEYDFAGLPSNLKIEISRRKRGL